MAVVTTPKFGLKTYTAGADPHPTREEFNAMIASIEDWGATSAKGLAAARPVAGLEGRFYWATDQGRIYYDDGVVWQEISTNGGGGAGTAVIVGGTGSEGTSTRSARADHVHTIPLATDSANGAMGSLDKAKLDGSTAAPTALRLVFRDANSRAQFGDPAAAADAATKGYVDAGLSEKANTGHTHSYSELTDAPTTNAPISWIDVLQKPSTFPPTIGTTATTAKAGNWFPAWSEVTSKPSSFPSDWGSVSGKPTTFAPVIGTTSTTAKAGDWVPSWSQVTGKPSTFSPILGYTSSVAKPGDWTPDWDEVSGKPSTFSPSSHSHSWSDVTSKPTSFTPASHTHDVGQVIGQHGFANQRTFNDFMHAENVRQQGTINHLDTRIDSTWNLAASKLAQGTGGVYHDANGIRSVNTFVTSAAYNGQFRAVWVHQDGRFGYNLSSRKFKTNEKPYVKPLSLLKAMSPQWFQYKGDVEALGADKAPWRANFIAEDLFDNDLKEFVSFEETGTSREDVQTINESFLVTVLWSFCQQQQEAIEELQRQMQELKEKVTEHVVRWFRQVTGQDWAWINFFMALGIIWPALTLTSLPPSLQEASLTTTTVLAWFGTAMAGAILAITGILMHSQFGTKWKPIGAVAELAGLILLTAGPLLFGLIYLYLFVTGVADYRPTVLGLALALVSGIAVRFTITVPRFRREAHDETKDL